MVVHNRWYQRRVTHLFRLDVVVHLEERRGQFSLNADRDPRAIRPWNDTGVMYFSAGRPTVGPRSAA